MLKIKRNDDSLDYRSFNFPAGEVGIKLDVKAHYVAFLSKTGFFSKADYQIIDARIRSSNDIIELAMAVDAIRRIDNTPINLFMPYCPYGRQDRVCDLGESFSLKVFADYINFLNFNQVTILDPHSNVTGAVFNNLKIITQHDLITRHFSSFRLRVLKGNGVFVSPDAGANKKTADIAGFFGHREFVRADKLRDLSTGEIKETIVYCDDFNGKDVFIADDICDGGRTFTELAKVCKSKNCGKIVLFVSHGVFSKGLNALFDNGIDEIFTTDSFYSGKSDINIDVLNLSKIAT